jgi:D-3-phosphoglycerate dehydrogenase
MNERTSESQRPVVVRLNVETCPPIPEEREILARINAHVIEIEGDADEEILAHAADCDALMVVASYVRTAVIQSLRKCRVISRLGIGTDKIDVAEATRQGIMVTNIPGFCTDEVADHTMALLLAAARQLNYYQERMRRGQPPAQVERIHRLSTQKLGIVGFGRIGRAVARRARAFGMEVLAHDPYITAADAAAEGVRLVDHDPLLAESDYLCLLCPLTDATRRMLTLREFRRMKPTAVLVNTGRGELVDEDDLVAALRSGVIRYAALDVFGAINVFSPEGFATDHPLFSLPNVLMTPHVAAYSAESGFEQKTKGAQAVVDVLTGRWPEHLVNPDVVPRFPIARATPQS